jgi:F-type H+-transporting ATPase subunit gamma
VIKAAGQLVVEAGRPSALALVGRRGRDFFAKRGLEVRYELVNLFAQLKFESGQAIARMAIEAFTNGEVDRVVIVYNEFKSVLVQRVVTEQLLPIPRSEIEGPTSGTPTEYLYEPSAAELFNQLIPTHVEVQVFRALLESNAAFYAAQMTAMDAATRNSGEMIEELTLYMNKVRQAAITREIIEVVSGAEAL